MGSLSCGMTCMKYLLLAFNFVFWVAGISVLAVGIWSRVAASDYEALMGNSDADKAANILIAAGVLVLIIGFVGCCGALKENKWLLLLYSFLVFLIFVLEIAAGVMAYKNRDKNKGFAAAVASALCSVSSIMQTWQSQPTREIQWLYRRPMEREITNAVNNTVFNEYGRAGHSKLTKAIDFAQKHIQCCGASSYKDWSNSFWGNRTGNQEVPKSCCKDQDQANCNKPPFNNIFTNGCIDAIKDWAKEHLVVLGGIGVGVAVIQVLGMIFAVCLFRAIGYEKI